MALQTSGAISLNDMHVEAGGSSGTQASINDADIRDMIGKGSGVQASFSEYYGASSGPAVFEEFDVTIGTETTKLYTITGFDNLERANAIGAITPQFPSSFNGREVLRLYHSDYSDGEVFSLDMASSDFPQNHFTSLNFGPYSLLTSSAEYSTGTYSGGIPFTNWAWRNVTSTYPWPSAAGSVVRVTLF